MGDPLQFLYSTAAERVNTQEPLSTTSAKSLELELMEIICQGIDPRTGELLETPCDISLFRSRLAYLEELRRVCGPFTDLNDPPDETSSLSITSIYAVDYAEQLLSECRFNSAKPDSLESSDLEPRSVITNEPNNVGVPHRVQGNNGKTSSKTVKLNLKRLLNPLKLFTGPTVSLPSVKNRWLRVAETLRQLHPTRSINAAFREDRYDWLPPDTSRPLSRDVTLSRHLARHNVEAPSRQPATTPSRHAFKGSPSARQYLRVPFNEKNDAKALGARWDAKKKQWYVPHGKNVSAFARWQIDKPRKLNIKGTSSTHIALFVDLVPRTAWFSNLRSELSKAEWKSVQRATFRAANFRCQACGGRGPDHPVECHERWNYDSAKGVQSLLGTIALCPACHEATHFGLAQIRGREAQALEQLMAVNSWTEDQAIQHINEAMNEWEKRSELSWKLDARWLIDFISLTDASKQKINDHATGLTQRAVNTWQREVIAGSDQHIDKINAVR